MKKASLAVLAAALCALAGAAYAQTDSGVTMSTDPAKAADVEQHAQELQARQQAMESTPAPSAGHHKMMKHRHHHHHHKAGKTGAAPAAGASE